MDRSEKTQIAIIVLNWNGWRDTLECLTSIKRSNVSNYKIVLLDNGSTDDSLDRIRSWAKGNVPITVGPGASPSVRAKVQVTEVGLYEIEEDYFKPEETVVDSELIFIKSNTNLGFARGCNVGIKCALSLGFDYIFLLNNDTTLESDCIEKLFDFLENNATYSAITPKICYYDDPDMIWNCGGRLTKAGSRKYYYFKNNECQINKSGLQDITFITGCALFARAEVFRRHGLLTEKFFFGEEDYEFSLRMKKNKIKMACLLSSKMYHKVSGTQFDLFGKESLIKHYIFYLNRFVNLKFHYSLFHWQIWRFISLFYILPSLFFKYKISTSNLMKFSKTIIKRSSIIESVGKNELIRVKKIFST